MYVGVCTCRHALVMVALLLRREPQLGGSTRQLLYSERQLSCTGKTWTKLSCNLDYDLARSIQPSHPSRSHPLQITSLRPACPRACAQCQELPHSPSIPGGSMSENRNNDKPTISSREFLANAGSELSTNCGLVLGPGFAL